MTLQVLPAGRFLVINGIRADTPEEAPDRGRELAERFLDVLYRDYGTLLFLNTTSSGSVLIDEVDNQGNVLGGGVNMGWGVMMYPSGQPPQSLIRDLTVSHAVRFLRKAAVSQDWFDKFRNYFLVLEYVGSRLWWSKKRARWRTEEELTEFAAEEAFHSDSGELQAFLQTLPGLASAAGETFRNTATFLVVKQRNLVNHAHFQKRGRVRGSLRIPFNKRDENAVRLALPLVSEIAHRLVRIEKEVLPVLDDDADSG